MASALEANHFGIVGYHFSLGLTATLNLCLIYFKITWASVILLDHMPKKFQKKIKGGCQSGRKVVLPQFEEWFASSFLGIPFSANFLKLSSCRFERFKARKNSIGSQQMWKSLEICAFFLGLFWPDKSFFTSFSIVTSI